MIGTKTAGLGNKRASGDRPNYSSVEIGQNHHYHHHVVPPAEISFTISRHPSLSSIHPGRSSRLHPVSAQSCIYVLAGRPSFAYPCEGVPRSTLHEFFSTSPAVSRMSGSANLDSFRDGW